MVQGDFTMLRKWIAVKVRPGARKDAMSSWKAKANLVLRLGALFCIF